MYEQIHFNLTTCIFVEKDLEGKTEEEKEMMKLMGFGNFDSTKVCCIIFILFSDCLKFIYIDDFLVCFPCE